jgi:hypothetical protein
VAARLGVYGVVLILSFGVGSVAGAWLGPDGSSDPAPDGQGDAVTVTTVDPAHGHGG